MWEDLIEQFENDSDRIYFMGSMVLITDPQNNRTFNVVDGQQRLTTLMLLFVAIKCMLQHLTEEQLEVKHKDWLQEFTSSATREIDVLLFNRKIMGVIEQEKKVRIERSIGFNYDDVL
jgi:uncharacterized protein with ParB-like and HNH nuclease domain